MSVNILRPQLGVKSLRPSGGTKSPSFWEGLFCRPECEANPCHLEVEETNDPDDLPEEKNFDGTVPIGGPALNQELSQALGLTPDFQGRQGIDVKLSMPWADMNGIQQKSLVASSNTENQSWSPRAASPVHLLAASSDNAPKVKFLTGIPTKAHLYIPELMDPIDVELHRALQRLDPEARSVLALRRVGPGRYEIDGRSVLVYWHRLGALVHETEVDGSGMADMPLQTYISLVANVALALQRSIADNSWPREFDAFTDLGATRTSQRSLDGDDRYRAMQMACMQARMREL